MGVAVLGRRYAELLDAPLRALGLKTIYLPDNPDVAPGLAGHTDLSLFKAGRELILAPYLIGSETAAELASLGYELCFADIAQGAEYPEDCGLNACAVGDRLLCREDITAGEILRRFPPEKRVRFKQGYAGCCICAVDDSSIITADLGIAAAAERAGLSVLRIAAGGFELPGYEYGFIGGASFKPERDKLVFTGELNEHPDKLRIESFIRERKIEPVYITRDKAIDIGGAVILQDIL